jgi:DNA-directed RNA polymerase subunit RPC12/RpoP
VNKSKKQVVATEKSKEITYKCLKCSYVFNKESSDVPPTFCPNCAINHLKGVIVRVKQPLDCEIE